MRNILITITYDGTNYFGWQKQNNLPTIENEIQKACSKIFVNGFELIGCSRTDRKVHALGQRATIKTQSNIPIDRICNALNSNLPKDIVVNNACEVDLKFHPRYDAKQKTYEYKILNSKYMIPQLRNFAIFEPRYIDIIKMKEASKYFIGEFDFKGFCSAKTEIKNTVRQIFSVDIQKNNDIIDLYFTGNGFLYNMVRILAGTLLDVGLSKIPVSDIQSIIRSRDRAKAGRTLPAEGLTLISIDY